MAYVCQEAGAAVSVGVVIFIVIETVLIAFAIYAAWMVYLAGRAVKAWSVALDWNRAALQALREPVPAGVALAKALPLMEAERVATAVARAASERAERWDVFETRRRVRR